MTLLITLLLMTFFGSPAQAQDNGKTPTRAAGTTPPASPHYRVGEGDVIFVDIYGEDDMSGSFTIGPGGALNYPMLQGLNVANKTVDEIAALLTLELERDLLEDPRVSVQVEQCLSQRVYVLGAVQQPGEFYLCGPTNLLDILARAGGVQDKHVSRVLLSHTGSSEQEIDYELLVNQAVGNVELGNGDRIFVPESLVVYVSGQVVEPGSIPYATGLTVTQAINLAGGFTDIARTRKIYLLRDGQRITIRLNRILKGRTPDLPVQPDDQILITESPV